LFRPKKQILNLGIDSLIVLLLYIVGIAGLFMIA
jgi:cation:H+ antiporter